MHKFRDNQDREWPVVVDVNTVRDVRSTLGVNLLALADGEGNEDGLIVRVMADPVLLVDILYVVCKRALDAATPPVTDREFGEALGGDSIDLATDALLAEIIDFFPNARDRERARKALEIVKGIMNKAADVLDAKLDPEKIDKATTEILQSLGD
jgi:hypothetical protein